MVTTRKSKTKAKTNGGKKDKVKPKIKTKIKTKIKSKTKLKTKKTKMKTRSKTKTGTSGAVITKGELRADAATISKLRSSPAKEPESTLEAEAKKAFRDAYNKLEAKQKKTKGYVSTCTCLI